MKQTADKNSTMDQPHDEVFENFEDEIIDGVHDEDECVAIHQYKYE